MAASNYSRGRAFEYRVRDDLRRRGYFAERTAGSHSVADVIAIKHNLVLLVQCKTSGACAPAEWNALFEESERLGCAPILADAAQRGRITYWLIKARKEDGRRSQARIDFDPGQTAP